ncbi:MAG: 50S ribosomal protein L21 [Candidatus Hydrogenedens sp.]|nr:50S ribosomal protein L21 [Candidatus Hydrogenedentota bacterium]NLF56949.1 50S ribosomal protein L21 [Candidatus Hydrogenedens sp.]
MYAVVTTGGKQYKVAAGDRIRVEKLDSPVGELVELGPVSMIAKESAVVVEPEALAGAKVVAEIAGHGLAKKIRVYKYKKRKGYERTQGHRQRFTELTIREIQG